ncbi:unnamed protein product [Prorocentrum cordatum]|uniref:Uncharacterized protein n=1 Tax=Prorocentrum cordatum TaxID=2364126 RepID=A0ABN9SPU1_9DINO|nr:unnamed protein product [Polarella glacialis]
MDEDNLAKNLRDFNQNMFMKAIVPELTRAILHSRANLHKKPEQKGVPQNCTILFNIDTSTDIGSILMPLMEELIACEGGTWLAGAALRGPLERKTSQLLTSMGM